MSDVTVKIKGDAAGLGEAIHESLQKMQALKDEAMQLSGS